MTRGQESLLIDGEMLEITIAPVHAAQRARAAVILLASTEELESHEHALMEIAKANGGAAVWHRLGAHGLPMSA
jgi:hypothetical protein